jgi:hypothetical protein
MVLTFARIEIGRTYAQRSYDITEALIKAYCRAIGAPLRMSVVDELSVLVAPPLLPAMWTPPRICFDDWETPPGGIHARQRWQSHAAIVAGSRLDMKVVASDKATRRQRNYASFDAFFFCGERLVAEGRMVIAWPI